MIPDTIGTARNPGGLVSVIYDRAGAVLRETNLSCGDDIDAIANDDGDTFNTDPGYAVLYDGDAGTMVATFERDPLGHIVGRYFGIPS